MTIPTKRTEAPPTQTEKPTEPSPPFAAVWTAPGPHGERAVAELFAVQDGLGYEHHATVPVAEGSFVVFRRRGGGKP